VVINSLLPASRTLRAALPIDEATFRTHTFHADAQGFFFWSVIDELEKVAMCLMRLDGFLDEPDASNRKVDSTERTAFDLVFEEERL
jgi:hypothetical protein